MKKEILGMCIVGLIISLMYISVQEETNHKDRNIDLRFNDIDAFKEYTSISNYHDEYSVMFRCLDDYNRNIDYIIYDYNIDDIEETIINSNCVVIATFILYHYSNMKYSTIIIP